MSYDGTARVERAVYDLEEVNCTNLSLAQSSRVYYYIGCQDYTYVLDGLVVAGELYCTIYKIDEKQRTGKHLARLALSEPLGARLQAKSLNRPASRSSPEARPARDGHRCGDARTM